MKARFAKVTALFNPRGVELKQQKYIVAGKKKEFVSTRFPGFARNDRGWV